MADQIIKGAVQGIKMLKGSFEQKKFNAALAKTMVKRLDFISQMLATLLKAENIDEHNIAITNLWLTLEEAQESLA